MKVTFDKNKSWFEFEFDLDKFGEGSIKFTDVKFKEMDIVDVDIELHDIYSFQQAGEIEIQYIMNEQQWIDLESEIKKQILEDPIAFDAHTYMSEDDEWNWYEYRQQQIQQANEDKF